MTRPTDPAFQQMFDEFDALCRKAEARGSSLSMIHPDRFEAIETYEELRTSSSSRLLSAVRVAFRLSGGDRSAFYRVDAHVLTGSLAFGAFDADRQLMDQETGDITFHAMYESRKDEHHALRTGAQIIQLSVVALHLERSDRLAAAQAIQKMIETERGAMPGYPNAPDFDFMTMFQL